jgi:hypothetical protein
MIKLICSDGEIATVYMGDKHELLTDLSRLGDRFVYHTAIDALLRHGHWVIDEDASTTTDYTLDNLDKIVFRDMTGTYTSDKAREASRDQTEEAE